MTLATSELTVFLDLVESMEPKPKRVATLGTLTLHMELLDIYTELVRRGMEMHPVIDVESYGKGSFFDGSLLFHLLGIQETVALDIISDGRRETIVQDLNEPVDEAHCNTFDLVVDGHTGDHVADRIACLKNAAKLLKKGGYVIHAYSMNPLVGNLQGFNAALLTRFYSLAGFDRIRYFQCAPFHNNTCFEFLGQADKPHYIENPTRYLYIFSARKARDLPLEKAPIERIYAEQMALSQAAFDVDVARNKTVAVWGTGGHYRNKVLPLLDANAISVWGFVDSDPAKAGSQVRGLEVHPPEALRDAPVDAVILASAFLSQILPVLCTLLAHRPEVLARSLSLHRSALETLHCTRLSVQFKEGMNMAKKTW